MVLYGVSSLRTRPQDSIEVINREVEFALTKKSRENNCYFIFKLPKEVKLYINLAYQYQHQIHIS